MTPIRIVEGDKIEYQRLVKNAKSKLRRVKKNYGLDLSDEVSVPKLSDFKTRDEFNDWKVKTASFTNRNNLNYQFKKNKHGVVANVKEINEYKRDVKKAQRNAIKKIKEVENLPLISGGKIQAEKVGHQIMKAGTQSATGISIPVDFNFDSFQSRKRFEQKKEGMEERANPKYLDKKTEQMKKNFMEILQLSFNSNADELVSKIDKMPADDFYAIYLMMEDVFDFKLYDSEQMDDDDGHIEQMMSYITEYEEGNINLDLKGFPNG